MNLKKWFHENIREKVLKVLDGLAARFKDDNGNPDWRKTVTVFSDFCENKLNPPLKDIVENVIETLKLNDEVEALRAFWLKIPEEVRDVLTKTLKDYSEPMKFEVLGKGSKGVNYGELKGPLGSLVDFKAGANLELVLQAIDRNVKPLETIGIEDDERFLKMGLKGKLEVSGKASFPSFPLGFVGIEGSGKAEAHGAAGLDYYYVNKSKWLFLEALIKNMPRLVSPFDAADIAGESVHTLKALQLDVQGSLDASIDVKAGKVWGTSFKVKSDSLNVNTDIEIGAKIEAGFKASFTLNGAWNVLVKPKDNRILTVKVRKTTSKEKNSAFTLDTSVGISGLDVVGNALVKKFMPDADSLIEKLEEFANFGDLIKKQIQDRLDDLLDADSDDTLKKSLGKALVGDAAAGDLADVIGSAVKDTLNEKLDLLEKKAANAGTTLIQGAVEKLNLPGQLETKLVNTAKGKLDGFLNKIEEKLAESLEKIIEQNKGRLEPIFKPLEAIGSSVADLVKAANENARQLLAPVITYLTRYQKFRNRVTKAVESSSEIKIGLHLGRTLKVTGSTDTLLEFQVDTANEKARQYYREMMAGNFVHALHAAGKTAGGSDGIELTGGIFKAAVEEKLTTDVSLNLFGSKFTAKTIMNSKVDVESDTTGNVMIVSSSTFERVVEALGESRVINFVNLMEIPGTANNNGGSKKLLSSGLSIVYRDENLKRSELKAFLGSFTGIRLISDNYLPAVMRRYDKLAMDEKKMAATIGLSMPLNSDDIKELITADENLVELTAIGKQIEIYFLTHRNCEERFDYYLAEWGKRGDSREDKIKKLAAVKNVFSAIDPTGRRDFGLKHKYLRIAWHIGRNAANLKKMLSLLKKVSAYYFHPDDHENNNNPDPRETNQKIMEEISGYNKKINKYLNDWLKVRNWLSSVGIASESLPYSTLAFIAIIGEICRLGQGAENILTPVIKWSVVDWKKELFV